LVFLAACQALTLLLLYHSSLLTTLVPSIGRISDIRSFFLDLRLAKHSPF
jgi:hypothetical protein